MNTKINKQVKIRDAQSGALLCEGVPGHDVIELEGCYYFAPETVNMQNLVVTARTYTCPYKGTCFWIDLATDSGRLENVAFSYHQVSSAYAHLKDRIGFYGRSMRGLNIEHVGA